MRRKVPGPSGRTMLRRRPELTACIPTLVDQRGLESCGASAVHAGGWLLRRFEAPHRRRGHRPVALLGLEHPVALEGQRVAGADELDLEIAPRAVLEHLDRPGEIE